MAAGAIIAGAGLGVDIITSIAGGSKSSQAADAQQEAQEAAWQANITAAQSNIAMTKERLAGELGDVSIEGAKLQRKQISAMGASGAEVGTGTPLMNMIETAAGIGKDKTRLTRQAQLEIDYYEQVIAENEELLKKPQKVPKRVGRGSNVTRPTGLKPGEFSW